MATTVQWTLNGTGGTLTGFSHCWSRNTYSKDMISLSRLDDIFDGNLLYVEGPGNAVAIKNTRSSEWEGNLVGVRTHVGYKINGNPGIYRIDVDKVNEVYNSVTDDTSAHYTDLDGRRWYEYEKQDFSDIGLGLGMNFVGYPYLNDGGSLQSEGLCDADGLNIRTIQMLAPDGSGSTTLAVWNNVNVGWAGGAVATKGACYLINCEASPGYPGTNIPKIETIFRHHSSSGMDMAAKYYSNRTFTGTRPQKPWQSPNLDTGAYKQVRVFINKPTEGGYGIKNINGDQLLTKNHGNAPVRWKPSIWWGSKGHCDLLTDHTDDSGRLATLSVEAASIQSIDSVADQSGLEGSVQDKVTVTFTGNHRFTTDYVANSGNYKAGMVGFVTGIAGLASHHVNGFRRIDPVDANTVIIYTGGPVLDQSNNSQIALAIGETAKVYYCGDGYGNLAYGNSAGNADGGLAHTYAFDNVTGQPTNLGINGSGGTATPSGFSKAMFNWGIHNGTPGGIIGGMNCREWGGFSGGIVDLAAGNSTIANGGGGWANGDSGTGFSGAADEDFNPNGTFTVDRFKTTASASLVWTDNRRTAYVGGWIPQRMSNPGMQFGVGNSDPLKIRVWDPLTQAFYAGKFVTSEGTPIAGLAGNVYYGYDHILSQTANTYDSTGWSVYFDRYTSTGGGQILTPKDGTNGIGIQLEEITTSN